MSRWLQSNSNMYVVSFRNAFSVYMAILTIRFQRLCRALGLELDFDRYIVRLELDCDKYVVKVRTGYVVYILMVTIKF